MRMRLATVLIVGACAVCAAQEKPPIEDDDPPFCAGRELMFTVQDGILEMIEAWCRWRDPIEFPPEICIPFVLSSWCPDVYTCSAIMCGRDLLVTHPTCIDEVSASGDNSQVCLDFYDGLRLP